MSGQLRLKQTWTGILQWAPPCHSLRCSSCWVCLGSICTHHPLQTLPFSRLSLQPTHIWGGEMWVFHKTHEGIHDVTSWHSSPITLRSHDGEPSTMSHSRNWYFSAIVSCYLRELFKYNHQQGRDLVQLCVQCLLIICESEYRATVCAALFNKWRSNSSTQLQACASSTQTRFGGNSC